MLWLFIMIVIAIVAFLYMRKAPAPGCSKCPIKKSIDD